MQNIQIGNISFSLREKHEFNWLRDFGEVFQVFAEQDSGNISFGVEKNGRKTFIKYAGAKTLEYKGKPEEAIERLKDSISIYETLQHPHLVKMIEHFHCKNGYALIFDWFDGECLHSHWSFPPPTKYNHPDSPFFRFRHLPLEQKLASLQNIFEFHVYVENKGYVAVDFYDGSILYDFQNHVTKICDIDYYKKKPFVNPMGRMWGSSRFMSPEEFVLGAKIDERTNVFNMGAIAFGLLGGELNRDFEKWHANEALYHVVMKAVEPERETRYATVAEFYSAWQKATRVF